MRLYPRELRRLAHALGLPDEQAENLLDEAVGDCRIDDRHPLGAWRPT
jgi:hypothetical protein